MIEGLDLQNIKLTKIYALSNSRYPNHFRYIGKTDGKLRARLKQHVESSLKKKVKRTYKENWIRSEIENGNNIVITLLDEVTRDQWQDSEKYYIAYYKSQGSRLTNSTEGGEGYTTKERVIKLKKEKTERIIIKRRKRKVGRPRKIKPKEIKEKDYFIDPITNKKVVITLGMRAREKARQEKLANVENSL